MGDGGSYTYSTPIEFNSNALVIRRINEIIDRINYLRDIGDSDGMLRNIIFFYKEISSDLTKEEDEIINKIKNLKFNNHLPKDSPVVGFVINKNILMEKLDEIDVELRRLAKIHGFLTSNKADPRKAITRR